LIETKKLVGTSHLKLVGICNCERCQPRVKKTPVGAAINDKTDK